MIKKNCLFCKKEFFTNQSRILKGNGKYCSSKCFFESLKKRVSKKCILCGKVFEVKKSYDKKGFGKFCSANCYFKSDVIKIGGKSCEGKPKNKSVRDKISKSKKGKASPLLGRIYKNKNLSNLTQLCYASKENKEWRKKIFRRDDYTCKNCGSKGTYLEAHHKIPRNKIVRDCLSKFPDCKNNKEKYLILKNCKELWDIENGITLCKKCHRLTGTYGGRAKQTK